MNKNIVRSLIAGSFSAVAALTLVTGTTAQASGGCDPIYTDNGDGTASIAYPDFCDEVVVPHFPIHLIPTPTLTLMPTLCTPLDLANLEVRASQSSPETWEWRYEINGDTEYLCDSWLDAEVWHAEVGMAWIREFKVSDIVEANNLGEDYIVELDLPCAYDTSTHFGPTRILLDEYLGLVKYSPECADLGDPAIDLPDGYDDIPTAIEDVPVDTTPDTTPADSDDQVFVDTAEVESDPVFVDTATAPTEVPEIPQVPETPRTPNEPELPRTGSDTTPLVIGAGMVVLGLGLGFTAVSMTRKRRTV